MGFSLQAFVNVVLGLCDVGDEVILTRPYYFSHLVAIQICGATAVVVDCDETLNPDVEKVREAITVRTKVHAAYQTTRRTEKVFPCYRGDCYIVSETRGDALKLLDFVSG